jgi:hypothetical protein
MIRTWWKQSNRTRNQAGPKGKLPWRRRSLRFNLETLEDRTLFASNVLVNDGGGATGTAFFTQSETTLVAFGNTVVVGFNDSGSNGITSNKFTGWSRSIDGGNTFVDGGQLPTNANGDAGDPALARDDTTGRIFFSTLRFSGSGIQVFHSDDNGATWSAPVNGTPGTTGFQDKEWLTVDNFAGAGNGNVYLLARDFGAGDGIYLYRSTDGGATFGPSGGTLIASGAGGNVQGAFVTVGPDHSVYAFYFENIGLPQRIMMRRSTDQGVTFGAPVTVATLATTGVNGNLGLTGVRNGTSVAASFRSNAFPHAAVNPVSGHLYVTFNNDVAGADKSDVFVVQSTDNGATWGAPVRVNDDVTTTDQWQPTLAVTPDGGNLGIFYYSRQEDTVNNNLFKFYGRFATISGATVTFAPSFAVSNTPSFPEFGRDGVVNTTYMGDYDFAVATPGMFHVTWADNRDDLPGGLGRKDPSVYYSNFLVATPETSITLDVSGNLLIQDINGGTSADTLTVETDLVNGEFVISDPNNLLTTNIAGATGNLTNTVRVPIAAVTGNQIIVNTLGGNDSVTFSNLTWDGQLTADGGTGTNTVIATSVQITSSALDGLNVMNTATFNVSSSSFDNNLGDGIEGNNVGVVSFTNVSGSGNDPGICIDGFVSFADVGGTYSNNTQAGVKLLNGGTVNLNGTTANSNGSQGVDISSVTGVTLTSVTADLNGLNGLDVDTATSVTITGGQYNTNDVGGIHLRDISGPVNISGVDASDNVGEDGADIDPTGDVTISNSTFNNNAADGIDLDDVGHVMLTNVRADGNGEDGVDVLNALNVTINQISFSGNDDDGIRLGNILTVSIQILFADNNGEDGVDVSNAGNVTLATMDVIGNDANGILLNNVLVVNITNIENTGNALNGTRVTSAGNVTAFDLNAAGNGGNGLLVSNAGNVSIDGSIFSLFNNNGGGGINLSNVGIVTIQDTTASSNNQDGILVAAATSVALTDVNADGNGDGVGADDGFDVNNVPDATVRRGSYRSNTSDGINIGPNVARASFFDVVAELNRFDGLNADDNTPTVIIIQGGGYSSNTDDGIELIDKVLGDVIVNVQANLNGDDGFFGLRIGSDVQVLNCRFGDNLGNGFEVDSFFDIFVDVSTFDGNRGNGLFARSGGTGIFTGVQANGNGQDGAFVVELVSLSLVGGTYNGNVDDGGDFDDIFTINVTGAQFNQNGDNGLELFGGAGLDDLFRTATILGSRFLDNFFSGIYVDGDTNEFDCTGDTTVLIGTAPGNGNQIEGNGNASESGAGIDVYGGCVIAMFNDIGTEFGGLGNNIGARLNEPDGFLQLECNQIVGNGQGVVNAGGPTIQAILNWWGSASGPSGAGSGTGDSVTAGVNFTSWAINNTCATIKGATLSGGFLTVLGGGGRDTITVSVVGLNVEVKVSGVPKQIFALADVTQHVVVYGFAGADSITISGAIVSEVHAGAGRDVVSGGNSKDIIWGDDGDDYLQGQQGHDVIIGGRGRDRISGGSGLDILFGGEFCKGNRHNGVEAYDFGVLCAISDDYVLNGVCDPDLFTGLEDDMLDTEQDRITGGANHPNLPGGGPMGDWFIGDFNGMFGPADISTDFLAPDKKSFFV